MVVITLISYYVGPVTGQDQDQGHVHRTTGGDRQLDCTLELGYLLLHMRSIMHTCLLIIIMLLYTHVCIL